MQSYGDVLYTLRSHHEENHIPHRQLHEQLSNYQDYHGVGSLPDRPTE